MNWQFGESRPSFFDVNLIFFLLAINDLYVDSRSVGTFPNVAQTLSDYQIQLLLAQEEAKCLEEFGGRENKTVYNHVFVPFTCINGSSTFTECVQCRNLTAHVGTPDECQTICISSTWKLCSRKCHQIFESAQQLLEASLFTEASNGNAKNLLGNGPSENYSQEEARPNRFENDLSSLSQHGRNSINLSYPGLLETPKIFCEDVFPSNSKPSHEIEEGTNPADFLSHVVFLTWNLGAGKSQSGTSNVSISSGRLSVQSFESVKNLPVVFVLEKLSSDDSNWITLGKRFSGLESVSVPYKSQRIKWRVTAVGPEEVLDRATSEESETMDGYVEPGPPKRIFVAKQILRHGMIDVLIGWDPPAERPCSYKIRLHPLLDTSQRSQTFRINEPVGALEQWFSGLKFGGVYDAMITSRTSYRHFESTLTSIKFTTKGCLEAYQNRFDKCEPPAPANISYQILSFHAGDKEEKGKVHVMLSWMPPPFTNQLSRTNRVENYTVSLGPTFNETGHNQSLSGATYLTHVVQGNFTQLDLGELFANTQYAVTLHANSTKGRSPAIQYILSTKLRREEDFKSSISNWFYVSIPMSAVVITLFGCHFLRVYFQKRQVKLARNHYFQSMEERDAMSCDWSIVPLNEDSPSFKLLHDFPKEKWEIGYESLKMGEVIGQGAFGVVRKAKLSRKTIQAVVQKYANIFNIDNVDADGMETVAVKMLKVAATRDDRDQLIKEIVTMQNLGCHPQIVSLLGACTKGRSLCLVLEYCPGGDLLTFLRKVRAKYWPMLGLQGGQRERSSESSVKSESVGIVLGGESEVTSMSSGRKSTDSSPINYADIGGYSNHSICPDKNSPPTTLVAQDESQSMRKSTSQISQCKGSKTELLNKTGSLDSDDDCRPIDERDVLSYARQVALGMEYLEKNHVVHRDLAGRNVLLLGDYKQVKISDFGLSRDIYTWNVYHQKSNGKLPIKWMAIESIFTHVFTTKSDVWSYGILLWELVTLGGTPYPGLGNTELFHLLKSGYRMERPDNCSEELYALMKKCWRSASGSRPNFTELHRFLETMLEAAEPNLYLSLMADLPTDYFHLGSRSDLKGLALDDDSPSCENSRPNHHYPNSRPQSQYGHLHSSQSRTSSIASSCNGSANCNSNSKGTNGRSRSHSHQHYNDGSSSSMRKTQYELRPRQPSPPKIPSPRLVSPDSGIAYRGESENDQGNETEDISEPLAQLDKDSGAIPLKSLNSITIIENKTYDITDL